MTEWISVKDRLPHHNKEVLVFYCMWIYMGYLTNEDTPRWVIFDHTDYHHNHQDYNKFIDLIEVTNWMPLPDKPL